MGTLYLFIDNILYSSCPAQDNYTICTKCDNSDINAELGKLIGEKVKLIFWFRSPTLESESGAFLDNWRNKLIYSETVMKKAMSDLSLEGQERGKNVQM